MAIPHRRGPRIGGGLLVIGVLLLVSGLSLAAGAAPTTKVVICHFEGHHGSSESHTIEVAPSAVSAHLASGFDYIGPCLAPSEGSTSTSEAWTSTTLDWTSTTVDWTSTTVETPTTSASTPTTVETTTTLDSTPTTVASPATTVETSPTVASTPTTEETATTLASPATTTSEDDTGVGAVGTDQTTSTTAPADDDAVVADVEELPYTGANMLLVIPGALLVAIGTFAVFVTGGLGHASAAHVASGADRFAMGLHRGRHQA